MTGQTAQLSPYRVKDCTASVQMMTNAVKTTGAASLRRCSRRSDVTTSNENKISDGYWERAPIEVEMFESLKTWTHSG